MCVYVRAFVCARMYVILCVCVSVFCVSVWQAFETQHCQKRPTIVSKETYYSVKRDLQ
jgi:hypothetical protein